MSNGIISSNESGSHFGTEKVIRCPADVIEENCNSKLKRYDDMLTYCTEVANGLPQRQAFYTFDLADVLWKVQEWKKSLPKVEIFYAVKANTEFILLQFLTKLGLSFDCASEGEIRMVLKAGASPKDIIFAHTIKPEEELKFALDRGVNLMTFDNEDELLKIQRVHPKARLLIRLSPALVSCVFDLSDKFGCSEEDATKLLDFAKQLDLDVVGISFHVGALCTDPNSFVSTIRSCRKLFDLAKKIGFEFSILDLGGGFYGQTGTQNLFYKMADSIKASLDEYFPGDEVRIIAEPGNYISVSAVNLVLTVLGKKCIKNEGEGRPSRYYYLNDGIYGFFFRDIECYGIRLKPLLPESEIQSRPEYESRLYGQTCCSEDVIQLSIKLPDLQVGERLVWENMGAYCRGVSSTFCGVPLTVPKYVSVQNQRLNMDWIDNKEEIENFMKKHVAFIGEDI